jgi:endogenous inhibitor of DNA gyrase (YacG/DUF329 family)
MAVSRTENKSCPKCGGPMHRQSRICKTCSDNVGPFTLQRWRTSPEAVRRGAIRSQEAKRKKVVDSQLIPPDPFAKSECG